MTECTNGCGRTQRTFHLSHQHFRAGDDLRPGLRLQQIPVWFPRLQVMGVTAENIGIAVPDQGFDEAALFPDAKGFDIELENRVHLQHPLDLGFAVVRQITVDMRDDRLQTALQGDMLDFFQQPWGKRSVGQFQQNVSTVSEFQIPDSRETADTVFYGNLCSQENFLIRRIRCDDALVGFLPFA